VAATLSPLASTASVRLRPNPRELPVINQIFIIVFSCFCLLKGRAIAGQAFCYKAQSILLKGSLKE
jgi:hypothetical protein